MKNKLNLNLLLLVFVGVIVASCSKNDSNTPTPSPAPAAISIVGNWKFAKDTLVQYNTNGSVSSVDATGPSDGFLNLKADGSYIAREDLNTTENQTGTYTVSGNQFTMYEPRYDSKVTFTIKTLNEHNLVLFTEQFGTPGRRSTYIEYFTR
ncbi:hypothetical protein FPZ43_06090 [Mucilaginibacter pallidiroseus]|uniref:Lipocalin-like domain-containing protein n=1 Tax=Mucilaginibacter pallidiroseus TaxID=2599295 RepID=A0A563UGV3_9SPHI|nr:lipocalin family protein [Mucilaginibacter pallidiroseus]TWR30508.1 hypothetical protein FPZ43_06090 [Mucilaginibacter pallidiroseus]